MNKTVVRIFLVIATLLIVLLVWDITFNDGGILASAYNGVTKPINDAWKTVTGGDEDLIPSWRGADNPNLNEYTNPGGI